MLEQIDLEKIPLKIRAMASAIKEAGGRAFIVGGAVRDMLLGLEPADWDIGTDLEPREILMVFPGASTCGIEFGRVLIGDVDVVSFRAEGDYEDKRHPGKVIYGVPLEKDLERRDFTVNAMALDPFSGELFDPFGGREDIRARVLRTVGDPVTRFREDPLRILRAIRLKVTLGLNLDPEIPMAIVNTAGLLQQVSGERIFRELKQILLSDSVVAGLTDLESYGVGPVVLPEVFSARVGDVARAVSFSGKDLVTRLTLLLRRSVTGGSTEGSFSVVDKIGTRFNLPAKLTQDIRWLLDHCDPEFPLNPSSSCARGIWGSRPAVGNPQDGESGCFADPAYVVRRIIYHYGERQLERLIDVKWSLWRGFGKDGIPGGVLFLVSGLWRARAEETGDFHRVALSGDDIMEILGVKSGPVVGEAISYLEEEILKDPRKNKRDELVGMLLEWWSNRR